jgi:hypothetical protein
MKQIKVYLMLNPRLSAIAIKVIFDFSETEYFIIEYIIKVPKKAE